jgi:hypothetical protein
VGTERAKGRTNVHIIVWCVNIEDKGKKDCAEQIYGLKGLSHEIDFKNFDKNLQN